MRGLRVGESYQNFACRIMLIGSMRRHTVTDWAFKSAGIWWECGIIIWGIMPRMPPGHCHLALASSSLLCTHHIRQYCFILGRPLFLQMIVRKLNSMLKTELHIVISFRWQDGTISPAWASTSLLPSVRWLLPRAPPPLVRNKCCWSHL